MNLVFSDGFRIELTSEITYTRYSPVFNALKGDWSFPFTIQGISEILAYFNYPHLPQASVLHKKTYDNVSLYEGSFLIGNGTLTLQDCTSRQIIAHLNGTVGNIPLKVFEKKLNTLDLGMDSLNTTLTKSGLYACLFSKMDNSNQIPLENIWKRFDVTVKLTFNGTQIWDHRFVVSASAYHESGTDTLQENLDLNIAEINQDWAEIGQPFELIIIKGSINLIVKDNATVHTVAMTVRTPGERGTPGTTKTYNFDRIEYQDIKNALDSSLLNTWTKPYQFPTIQDSKFYDEAQNKIFFGNINEIVSGVIQTNDYLNRTKYTICPQFFLIRILKLIFFKLDYTPEGPFIQDVEILKILILSLYALDKQAEKTTLPFNVHSTVINYRNHLPDITLSEFLKALMEEFGMAIEFNALTKTVELFFVKDVLKASDDILNLNDRVGNLPKNSFGSTEKTQISYNLSGDSLAKDETSPYISVPTKAIVDADTDKYEPYELKFPPLTKNSQNLPAIEAAGISPLFNQSKNETPLRLFFFEDKVGRTETAGLSLDLTKENSIYQKYIKPKIDFELNTEYIQTPVLMTLLEIVTLSPKTKILAYNVLWCWDSITPKLKTGQESYQVSLKLKRA